MSLRNSVRLSRADVSGLVDGWNGRLRMWELPDDEEKYVLGVDAGQGVGRDRSVIEVLRVGDKRRPDEQAAEFVSNFHDPIALAEIAVAIGRLYGGRQDEALAVVEINTAGGGHICQTAMRNTWQYANLYVRKRYDAVSGVWSSQMGWSTNQKTRPEMVVRGSHAINSGDLLLHSPELLYEMAGFDESLWKAAIRSKTGEAHDDRVMALLMAYWGAHDEEWLAGEDLARERHDLRRATAERLSLPQGLTTTAENVENQVRRDFQNTAVSSEAYDAWADELAFRD